MYWFFKNIEPASVCMGGGFPTCQRTVYNMDREKSKYYNNSLMFNMTEQLLPLGGEVFPHGIHKPSI